MGGKPISLLHSSTAFLSPLGIKLAIPLNCYSFEIVHKKDKGEPIVKTDKNTAQNQTRTAQCQVSGGLEVARHPNTTCAHFVLDVSAATPSHAHLQKSFRMPDL